MCCFVYYQGRAWFCSRRTLNAIHLGKNSTFHSRSNHVDLRYQWIRDALDAKLLELAFILMILVLT
ncbi:hypothetical protein CR513_51368, partial [Mucuna pruriens]